MKGNLVPRISSTETSFGSAKETAYSEVAFSLFINNVLSFVITLAKIIFFFYGGGGGVFGN